MPSGVYKRTEKGRKNLSLSHIGYIQSKEQIEKRVSQFREEKSVKWKGDKVGYRALHLWIENKRGKPHYCEHCKKSNLSHRCYHWANKSKEYKRKVNDWIRLCVKCHKKYDKDI